MEEKDDEGDELPENSISMIKQLISAQNFIPTEPDAIEQQQNMLGQITSGERGVLGQSTTTELRVTTGHITTT